ncbi:MAG TPA: CoA-binding protein [Sphingomonadales bacterium]
MSRNAVNHDDYSDEYIADILRSVKVIAMVGASNNELRPSFGVRRFLQRKGYRVIPVNPGLAGKELDGETVYARLADIPEKVDMVDVFRRREDLPQVFDEAIEIGPSVIWTQLGLRDDEAAARAEAQGIKVVMDRCPAIEMPRLGL